METAPQQDTNASAEPNGMDTSTETVAATTEAAPSAEAVGSENVPVPVSEPVVKESLWRRMTMRTAAQRAEKTSAAQDLVKSRLDGITLRLESIENALTRSDERLDERLARLWEIEEQLESLQDLGERTTEARDAAVDAASAAQRAGTLAGIAAVLAGLAVVGLIASIAFPEFSL